MADRFLLKKFASETQDCGQFGSFQENGAEIGDGVKTTDPALIQGLSAWLAGWGNAVDNGLLLPRLEEMNGVQRVFSEMLWNQWRDGITFWQEGAPVKALQSIVMYQTGDELPKLYINKTGVNGTNPPPEDTDNWETMEMGGGSLPLLSPVWSDHLINDMAYVRADTFSWHNAVPYANAYSHLVADIEGKTPQAETIGGVTITYYLADDGHKIVLPGQESNVLALYNNTGVAWYYILDTTNERFKLPRTKYGFVGDRGNVGNYVPESLPNIKGSLYNVPGNIQEIGLDNGVASGAIEIVTDNISRQASQNTPGYDNYNLGWKFDASRSSPTYQNNAPVQQRATEMYLYFYVGNFTQSASEQTAGLNAELFNAKADIDAGNFTATGKETVVGWGMPDYSAGITIPFPTASSPFIAPTDGIAVLYVPEIESKINILYINGQQTSFRINGTELSRDLSSLIVPFSKNEYIAFDTNVAGNYYSGAFYPYKGAI